MLGRHARAAEWLRVWADLGRAPRTIDAYARGLAEYLQVCEREGVDPVTANRAHVAGFVRESDARPSRRGANVVALDSGVGLANATLQQRLVAVRLFYDFLIEEGVRESTRSAAAGIRRGGGRRRPARAWCRGWSSCRGSRPKQEWLRRPGRVARRAGPQPADARAGLRRARCAARSCARCAPTISIPASARCGSGRRRRRTGVERVVPYSAADRRAAGRVSGAPGDD